MKIKGISAIVLVSRDPKALSRFYEKIFGLHFTKESHGDLKQHFVVSIGDLRLIIHPTESYTHVNPKPGAVTFYLSVDSLESLHTNLSENGIRVLKIAKENFGERIEFKDLDGNVICAVQLQH